MSRFSFSYTRVYRPNGYAPVEYSVRNVYGELFGWVGKLSSRRWVALGVNDRDGQLSGVLADAEFGTRYEAAEWLRWRWLERKYGG